MRLRVAGGALLLAFLAVSSIADSSSDREILIVAADAARVELATFEAAIEGDLRSQKLRPLAERDSAALKDDASRAGEEYRRYQARLFHTSEFQAVIRMPGGTAVPAAAAIDTSSPAIGAPTLAGLRINLQPFRYRDSRFDLRYLEDEIPGRIAGCFTDTSVLAVDPSIADVIVSGEIWNRRDEIIIRATVQRGRRSAELQWVSPEANVVIGLPDCRKLIEAIVNTGGKIRR